ncbi:carboxypeptidase-like regulatory domain-containing protein [Aquimarina gracilis]|uniref:Carboxypeptidase-like regulatory domain-containing protein n=1 Tax=Aquimarina gracilis TaxID=874422 RepID=A0ABU6A070_9FLAO|nr:carboxypeptidase-like regulatory domain-containing protein [Aquimarina gracilis]MEB3347476.1 carboxypeptidase-like regulatory domain-containing protein [Aquimarina gracilis]
MKKITFLLVVILIAFVGETYAQGVVTGTIFDGESNAPLPGANIVELRTSNGTSTDFDGKFSLKVNSPTGTINVSYVGFGSKNITYDVTNGDQDLGTITLSLDNSLEEIVIVGTGVIDLAEDRKTPIAVTTVRAQEIQEKAAGNVEVAEIIKNTPSVFISNQTGFGDGALFVRGFDDTNTAILLNGQPINSQEDGRVFWSNWAGVTDIANAVQVQRGLGSSKLAISSVGGTVNIVMKAADRNKGGFARFLGGNDSYAKGTLAYDTGMNENGWAFSVLVDYWQAHRKWAEGTHGYGQNYFFAVGYKPNEQHNFNFLITGAPQFHAQRFSQSNTERFAANSRFNENWGYSADFDASVGSAGQYTSDVDTERGNYYHKPVTNLNWDWNINEKSSLSSVLYASWGRGGSVGPRGARAIRTDDPDGDGPLIGQIDFYNTEQRNLGIAGGIGDNASRTGYVRRNSVNNHQWYGLISNFNTELTEKISWNVGVDFRLYRGDHFRQITDFHGLQGWANDRPDGGLITESYDSNPWAALFDFADEDQRIDYDYSENINYQGLFSQIEYGGDKFSAFFQGAVSNQSFIRRGRLFEDGDSDKLNKIGYNLKGGFGYTIEDQHTLYVNSGFYSRQPFLDNIFQNIRRSNDFVQPEVDNEDILGVEAGYRFRSKGFQVDFNAYYTNWDNRVILSNGTDDNGTPNDDSDDIFFNIFDRGVNQIHTGAELEFVYNASEWLDLKGYISGASWRFNGEINKDIYDDDTNELISSEEGLDLNGIKVDTAPQFTAGLGTKVRVINGLFVDANINYYAEHYLDDPDSRGLQTQNVGKIKPYSLTDVGLTYNFKFDTSRLVFRANAFNIFDEVRAQSTNDFGFIFTNGITFNGSLSYKF